jgi:hypothetical protein
MRDAAVVADRPFGARNGPAASNARRRSIRPLPTRAPAPLAAVDDDAAVAGNHPQVVELRLVAAGGKDVSRGRTPRLRIAVRR